VLRLIVVEGATLALTGVVVGVVAALGLTRVMKSLLYEVSATDPPTFILVSLVLIATALAACIGPARRATRVDPMAALRCEDVPMVPVRTMTEDPGPDLAQTRQLPCRSRSAANA